MKISLISLGCPKNRVDAEVILGLLGEAGYCLTQFPEEADIIIINTCSFIDSARIEAKRAIERYANSSQKLIVCGCLPQMMRERLFNDYPYIDAVVGSAEFYKLPEIVLQLLNGEQRIVEIGEPTFIYNSITPRLLSTPKSYAYLKIAEGCSNCCSYCRIPNLRGRYRSREIKDIINEANMLVELGVKEIILIAQDTTNFGIDTFGSYLLSSLLTELDELNNLQWIRLLYTHPAHFTDSLISVMSESKKICKYIDIPLQHTHPDLLNQMGRPKWEGTRKLLSKLKSKGFALRTTFLVGFPGEEEYHFAKLLKDIEKFEFDWVGAFTYSQEEGTCASKLGNQISDEVKKERLERLLEVQIEITKKKNEQRIGNILQVLVDTAYTGHTEFQAPDLDGKVIFKEKVVHGKFLQVEVEKVVQDYDLEVELKV